jgi:hypothetical protein
MSEPLRDQPSRAHDDAGGDEPERVDPTAPGPGLPPPTAVESLVNALLESGPEVAEHVVNAAKELLLAAQTIVEAAERAVQEQQEVRARAGTADDDDAPAVRHLDVAE